MLEERQNLAKNEDKCLISTHFYAIINNHRRRKVALILKTDANGAGDLRELGVLVEYC